PRASSCDGPQAARRARTCPPGREGDRADQAPPASARRAAAAAPGRRRRRNGRPGSHRGRERAQAHSFLVPSETDTVTSIEHREGESVPGTPPASVRKELEVPRTRTSSAWVAAASGALLLLLMLVFILQNGDKVRLHFLWLSFSLPLGVALLLAG